MKKHLKKLIAFNAPTAARIILPVLHPPTLNGSANTLA